MSTITDLATVREMAANGTAREIRMSARLSLQEVADTVGVGAPTVARWEAGDRRPRGEAALRYYDLLRELQGLVAL